jgi:hypothetical protein
MKLCGLQAMGVVHDLNGEVVEESKDQHEGEGLELFAMFDVEHAVESSGIVSIASVAGSSEAARQDMSNNTEGYYSTRSVLRSADLDDDKAVQHFTIFETESLPKPLYKLFQSEKLKKRLASLPTGVTVLRLFLVYFYDGVNIFRKANHSTGAGYITLGGLPLHLQDLLRNLIPVHLVPPGADLRKSLEPFLARVMQLQEGIHVHLGEKIGPVFLVGGLGLVRADMPQGHEFAGNLKQGAHLGCRLCKTHQKDFDKVLSPTEAARVVRTIQGTQATRAAARSEFPRSAPKEGKKLRGEGLAPMESVFAEVNMDYLRQCPYEPFHSEKIGFAKKFLNNFCTVLDADAFRQLNERIELLTQFPAWPNKVKPVTITSVKKSIFDRKVKMNGTQAGMVCSVLPLIVRDWLQKSCFHKDFRNLCEREIGDSWLEAMRSTVVLVARSNALCYAPHHPGGDGYRDHVHEVVKSARHACAGFWYKKFKNPTQHLASHMPEMIQEMGAARNVKASKCEAKHSQIKFGAVHLNGRRSPEVQMMFHDNQRQASMFMAHGGYIHLPKKDQPGKAFKKAVKSPFITKLLSRSASSKTYAGEVNGADDIVHNVDFEVGAEVNLQVPIMAKSVADQFAGGLERLGSIGRQQETEEALRVLQVLKNEGEGLFFASEAQSKYMTFYDRVDVVTRPPYCRRIEWGRFYTVATPVDSRVPSTVASARIGRVDLILRLASTYWAMVTWMNELEVQDTSGLKVLGKGGTHLCLLEDVLEPRYVVHRCDSDCTTKGPGVIGVCGDTNEYLYNEYVIM